MVVKQKKLDKTSYREATFRELVAEREPFTVKYAFCLELDEADQTAIIHGQGSFLIDEFVDPTQKFYSDHRTVEIDKIPEASCGYKIIRIRNLLFINAMIYFETTDQFLRLKETTGYFNIKVSNTVFRKIAP